MAEVFATVASGAGLASLGLQLAECAVKLKVFYENAKKAPKALQRISREINTFALLLRQIDETRSRYGVADCELLAECIDPCIDGTQEILLLTSQLEAIMRKHHAAGGMYSALRMRDVVDICNGLERAKNNLMLAFQVFDLRTQVRMMDASRNLVEQQSLLLLKQGEAIARIREDTSMILDKSSMVRRSQNLAVADERSANDSYARPLLFRPGSEDEKTVSKKRRDSIHRHQKPYRFRLPLWFSKRVWEMTASRSLGRWQLCIQTYNQQPAYSPIVAHYLAGRVAEVRRMFQNGQASPHDIYGTRTPLELAVLSGSTEMFQYLQTCDFIDGHGVLDRTLNFWTSVWFDMVTHNETAGNAAGTSSLESPKRLLSIIDCLMQDQRTDIEENYGVDIATHHFWSCPSEILLQFNSQLFRPLDSLTAEERLALLDLRISSNEISPALFASLIPSAKDLRSSVRNARIHSIAFFMGRQIRNIFSKPQTPRLNLFWHLVSRDPILQLLEKLLSAWIRLGSDLYEYDKVGYSPLLQFIDAQRRWMRSTEELQLVQYWAKCMAMAGVNLLEYGARELLAWKRPIRVGWRRDTLHGYTIRVFGLGFCYGQSAESWRLDVDEVVFIPVYKLESPPGSWPSSSVIPQEICWRPSTKMVKNGERWVLDREYLIVSDCHLPADADATTECIKLLKGTQDDSLAAARLLARDHHSQATRRRTQSEPPPIQRNHILTLPQDTDKPWLRGYFHYCAICYDRFSSDRKTCHRYDHNQKACSEERIWESERLLRTLLAWRKFVREHVHKPVQCLGFAAGALVNTFAYRLVHAPDVFGHMEETWFCSEFPHCLHQRSYLDLMHKSVDES